MILQTVRNIHTDDSSIGEFFINDKGQCFTLEDKTRGENEPHVYGATAIPLAEYRVTFRTEGTMFQRLCEIFTDIGQERGSLQISNIDDGRVYPFWYKNRGVMINDFVLIHPGVCPADTLGCLLLGMTKEPNGKRDLIGDSRIAYRKVYPIIADALTAHEDVRIQYIDGAA
jgi:hypothetical protein